MRLPEDRMPEAEVALLLAEYLLALPGAGDDISVAVDGAGVKVKEKEIFPMSAYLESLRWQQTAHIGRNPWTGSYTRGTKRLELHSKPGSVTWSLTGTDIV